MTRGRVLVTKSFGEYVSFIGRVIEDLDLKQISWIVQLYDFIEKPLDYISFVIDRQLHGHARQIHIVPGGFEHQVFPELPVATDGFVAMNSVYGQNCQNGEVRN